MISQKTIRRRAEEMLAELDQQRYEVILTPAPDQRHAGHMVRTVAGRNPEWYRQLCDRHQKQRGLYTARCAACGRFHDSRKGAGARRCRKGRGRARKRQQPAFKSDTSIKRADVIRALHHLIEGRADTVNAKRLLDVITREWQARQDLKRHRNIMLKYLESAARL